MAKKEVPEEMGTPSPKLSPVYTPDCFDVVTEEKRVRLPDGRVAVHVETTAVLNEKGKAVKAKEAKA